MTDYEQELARSTRLATQIQRLGYAILLIGLTAALAVYLFADGEDQGSAGLITDSRSYQYNLERIGGKFMVLSAELSDWFASLWQTNHLPVTLAVLAAVLALLCFWLAHLIALPPLDEEDDESRH